MVPKKLQTGPEKPAKPVDKRPGKADAYHHGDLRRALMDAASQQLATGGVDAVKMNLLASQLGVSVAAPYRHFATREALLVELAEQGAQRMGQAMNEAAAQCADPLQAQRARGVAYVRFCVQEPAVFRLLQRREVIGASSVLQALDMAQRAAMEPVLGRHHHGQASAEVMQRSAGMLAAQALTFGLAHILVDGLLGEVDPDTAALLAQEVTEVLGVGLAGRE